MPEFVIFLHPTDAPTPLTPDVIREHCAHLNRLDSEGRLIAAGPFSDAAHGGMVVGSFADRAAAERFAAADPFVCSGGRRAEVRPWEWSSPQNGHLGVFAAAPGGHPRLLETLHLRATTREFSTRPIPAPLVEDLLAAALAAPSEFNLQPWRPIVCHDAEDRRRLQQCCLDQPQVAACGLAVICAVDPRVFLDDAERAADEFLAEGRHAMKDRRVVVAFIRSCYQDPRDACIRNGTLFGHQLLLAGVSQGLAGFWLGGFDEVKLRAEFDLPQQAVIAGIVGLGWAAAPPQPKSRQPMERTTGWGRWPAGS